MHKVNCIRLIRNCYHQVCVLKIAHFFPKKKDYVIFYLPILTCLDFCTLIFWPQMKTNNVSYALFLKSQRLKIKEIEF